jgi:serine protease Do
MMKKTKTILLVGLILSIFFLPIFLSCGDSEGIAEEKTENGMSESLKQALDGEEENTESQTSPNATSAQDQSITMTDKTPITPYSSVMDLQNSLREIADKRIPAVVNIRSEMEITQDNRTFDFYDFFRPFMDEDEEDMPKRYQEAFGSGFIISNDGYVVTNHHVVANAVNVTIVLADEREFEGEIVGTDDKTDTALLKIESDEPLPTVPLGNSSEIRVGDIAVAIGNPFGLSGSFTMGVISATGRDTFIDRDASFKDYIQTDAPINQGNSGGPLLNIYGEVIGMNTAIYSTTGGGSIGIGFAIPINIVKRIVQDLADDGKIERPMLGLTVRNLDEDLAQIYNIEPNEGAMVNDVVEGSPADQAGIQPQDVIISIDGEDIGSSTEVVKKVVSYEVGDTISVTLLRLKNQTEVERISVGVTLGLRDESVFETFQMSNGDERPDTDGGTKDWMGMTLGNVSDYAQQMGIDNINNGVIILEIEEDTNASEKGLTDGIIITSINGVEIKTIEDLNNIKKADYYMLRVVLPDGNSGTVVLKGK